MEKSYSIQKYLSDVLGIREIIMQTSVLAQVGNIKIIFLDDKSTRSCEGAELLKKMISAMKLNMNQYQILEIGLSDISDNLQNLESAAVTVCFSKNIFEFIQNNFPRVNIKYTFSPEDLLKNPESKRVVWELLKTLM
jgi:hypothetical protein